MSSFIEATSLLKHIPGVLEEYFELFQLECRYESEVGRRRLVAGACAALCLVTAFVFIQIALVDGLLHVGVPLYAAVLGLALVWSAIGFWIFHQFGQRDVRVGEPFEGTRHELRRNLQWMQKHLS